MRDGQTAWLLSQPGGRDEDGAKTEEFSKLNTVETGGDLAGTRAVLLAACGKKCTAEEKIKSALGKRDFGHLHHAAYYIASAYAPMGEPEPSIYWPEQAAETSFPATRCSSVTPTSTASASLRASSPWWRI